MERKAFAVWNGSIREGSGVLTTDSGVLSETQYSFSGRFEDGIGTNPEELIGAAHAGCYAMALSGNLGRAGLNPEKIRTDATVTLVKKEAGFAITAVHLDVSAKIPGADNETFQRVAEDTKMGCPVSQVLNAEITLEAKLEA
ncbi:MAG: OsmC family protein [Rhodothermia bacterium]|nr:OsmC family protein [Rhodothermia bacterium]